MISPKTLYPSNIDTTDLVGYPEGKAKNITTPGDNTGTPLDSAWLNDWFGFSQALLAVDSATPSGTPEKVGASQLVTAIQNLSGTGNYARPAGNLTLSLSSGRTRVVMLAGFTLTLPATPADGTNVAFASGAGVAASNITLTPQGGDKVGGDLGGATIDKDGAGFNLIYNATSNDWEIHNYTALGV